MSKQSQQRTVQNSVPPDAVTMRGFIGARFTGSRVNRLINQEEDHLLWPFEEHCSVGWEMNKEKHPEIRGDWQGEYIGTWLDAAVLSAWNADDKELKAKIEAMVERWLATQEDDGYFGTYDGDERWESWALWVHAHDMIGLLSYYRYTGDGRALEASVRAADLILATFGPGKRSVAPTGGHMGMASSSILEPMVWLYFETGDERYRDWSVWLVDEDWETDAGAKLVSSLRSGRGVARSGNAKGIEMLTNFAGLVELYRATGNTHYLEALEAGWSDIVRHHLYVTGSASTGELFTPDFVLRNDGIYFLGETCVSMGWLYFNLKMGCLTGEARFYDMAEQTLYNHLLAAQSPDGKGWAYYLGLRDHKRYRWHVDPECCPTRGVRALAHIPQNLLTTDSTGVVVNFYEPSQSSLTLENGTELTFEIGGNYPSDPTIPIIVTSVAGYSGTVRLRIPGWCSHYTCRIQGADVGELDEKTGYLVIEREWTGTETVVLDLAMEVRVVTDRDGNNGRAAVVRGPLVYAADASLLPDRTLVDDVVLSLDADEPARSIRPVGGALQPGELMHLKANMAVVDQKESTDLWREGERYEDLSPAGSQTRTAEIELVPFCVAGNAEKDVYRDGHHFHTETPRRVTFSVWLPYQIQ